MNLLSRLASAILVNALSFSVHASSPLPALGASADATSVSGLSSGAFMAEQYLVAYSSSVIGAGIVAGGPYYCAAGFLFNAGICMGQVPLVPPNPDLMLMSAKDFASDGRIDSLSNLERDKVYVFSGTNDLTVRQIAVDATVAFFKKAGVTAENLVYVNKIPAGHALITPKVRNACAETKSPFVSHCAFQGADYDQPGEILAYIYGPLNSPAKTLTGQLLKFNQREFASASTSMAQDAFVYIPSSCAKSGNCKVHVAFHGCQQSAGAVKDDFYGKSSYNAWAESNGIIMLYPQMGNPKKPPLDNLGSCWDWYGYTGANYAFKSAPQMKAVRAMIERLTMPSTSVAAVK